MTQTVDKRQLIIDATGHVLVLGGPGSGKTTVALRKAMSRIDQGLIPGQSVLFLSFSRAAVARIRQAAGTEIAQGNKDALSIQTIHSWCWELLRSHAYLLGAPKNLKVLLPHDEKALSAGITANAWRAEKERLFLEEGRMAFDLFAPKAKELLVRSTLIRHLVAQRFPLLILDEAQDTGSEAWSCIQVLAPFVQTICLADLEQQIFDYLPGVGPDRIARIKATLEPLVVDLGGENYRSEGTDILAFANDIVTDKVSERPYKGVTVINYVPKDADYVTLVRQALAIVLRQIEKETGKPPESCAFLAPIGAGVARISNALNSGEKPVLHKVIFDQAEVLLASRVVAFLLEPKTEAGHCADVAECLELIASIRRASGSKTSLGQAENLLRWAEQVRGGQNPKVKAVAAANVLVAAARNTKLTGDPKKDWMTVKRLLGLSLDPIVAGLARHLDLLVAFNRGKRISSGLSAVWTESGRYTQAREALDEALAEDAILSGLEDMSGIHVMTIHSSKSKQFDGVVVFDENRPVDSGVWQSSLIWRDDPHPHPRSRKILRVAVTRARRHVLILKPAYPRSPILSL